MKPLSGILVLLIVLTGCLAIAGCTTNSPVPTFTPTPSPPITPAPSASGSPVTSAPTGGGQTVNINLVALNLAFDQSTITVPAGSHVVMIFDNQDSGVVHNFALYTDSTASKKIFVGDLITGPKKITFTFDAPSAPGTYFFRCDIHPTTMVGTFVVT